MTNTYDPKLNNSVVSLREEGKSLREIGKILGISHQRVHQIYKNNELLMLRKQLEEANGK